MIFIFIFISFIYVAFCCRSIEISRSSAAARVSNPGGSLPSSIAQRLIGGRAPCGGRVCSSCRTDLSYKTITKTWGKLTLRGFKGFIAVLDRAFNDMYKENRRLLGRIGSRGTVCCRLIRRSSGGCSSSWSNHAFGMAMDLKVDNYNDAHGDGCVHKPLFEVHKFFTRYGLYWGKDFGSEDAMHWEVSRTLAEKWLRSGVPSPGGVSVVPPPKPKCQAKHGSKAKCIPTAQCRGSRERFLCPGPADIQCCYNQPTPRPPTKAPSAKPTPRPTPRPVPEVCVTTFGKDAKCQSESTCKGVVRKEKAYCRNSNQVCCAQNLCAKALGSSAKCIGEEQTCEGRVESNLCPSKQRCCLPPTDYPPVGKIRSVNNVVSGWACDKNSPEEAVDVHIYLDKPAGSGIGTSLKRTCPQCLGKKPPSDVMFVKCGCLETNCNVGFELDFDFIEGAAQFAGKTVQVYGYVINTGPGGKNLPLGGPVNVSIPVTTVAPTPVPTTLPPGQTPAPTPEPTENDLYVPKALPACFAPDACDSSLPCCDFCTPLPAGVLCKAGGEGGCKADSFCDGINPYCASRARQPHMSPCDDGNDCTGPDMCTLDGTCFGEPKKGNGCVGCTKDSECDDGNPCSADECVDGECKYRVDSTSAGALCRRVADDLSCDFEEFCTGQDITCPEDVQGCLRDEFDGDADPGFVDKIELSQATLSHSSSVSMMMTIAFTSAMMCAAQQQ